MRRKADGNQFQLLEQVGQEAGDKRFLAQLSGVQALAQKGDWRGVTLGCKMLYKIAHEGGFLEKIEAALRPLFDHAVRKFEQSRAAMLKIHSRLAATSRRLAQVDRLAKILRVAV